MWLSRENLSMRFTSRSAVAGSICVVTSGECLRHTTEQGAATGLEQRDLLELRYLISNGDSLHAAG